MALFKIINHVEMTIQGATTTGKQGTSTDSRETAFNVTIDGPNHVITGTRATGNTDTLWTSAGDLPTTFKNIHFASDQDVWIQLINSVGYVALKVTAKEPFTLGTDDMFVDDDSTTVLTTTEPTTDVITTIAVHNSSGSDANYRLILVK